VYSQSACGIGLFIDNKDDDDDDNNELLLTAKPLLREETNLKAGHTNASKSPSDIIITTLRHGFERCRRRMRDPGSRKGWKLAIGREVRASIFSEDDEDHLLFSFLHRRR